MASGVLDAIRCPAPRRNSGGIRYRDLALRRSGGNVMVEVSDGERITLAERYADPQHRMVQTIQVIAEAMQGYSQASANPLLDDRRCGRSTR
jgi:hypothetical protein